MKKTIILFITLAFLGLSLATAAENATATSSTISTKSWWKSAYELSWSNLPNTLYATYSTCGVWVNNKYYQICGSNDLVTYACMSCWNGSSWSQVGAHPGGGVEGHSATVYNNRIIISGGGNLDYPGYFYNYTSIYNPNDNTWVQSTPVPLTGLMYTAMASVNGKCYLFGGRDSAGSKPDIYEWIPGDGSMVPQANMPGARYAQASAEYNNCIYVFGGASSTSDYKNDIWKYNPTTDTWTVKSLTLITARYKAKAVTIGDRIYVMGGAQGTTSLNTVEVYNPIDDTISSGGTLPFATAGFGAVGYLVSSGGCTYTGHIIISGGTSTYISNPTALALAAEGTVLNVTPTKVQPTSLGSVKALYH